MWEYTDKVKELYKNPKNVGVIEDADAVGEEGSIVCGDALKIYLKVNENVITDAKFQTFGCGSAIASSSALTEMIKGKTLEDAQKITNKDIVDYLGGLPEEKMHCSVMGSEALEKAISAYKGIPVQEKEKLEGKIVCKCFGVTDTLIRKAIRENKLKTIENVTHFTKAGGGCGSCVKEIEKIIEEELNTSHADNKDIERKPALTNIKRIQLVEKTIDDVIRPRLREDGGDIELVDVDGKRVIVSMRGSCSGCVSSGVTLKKLVQEKLREFVEEDIIVEEQKF